MEFFKKGTLFLAILLSFAGVFFTIGAAEGSLSLSAKSAILINAETGDVYFSKNAEEKLPMASTTKIMTALVALESSNLTDTVEIDRRAVGIEGSSVYLTEGELLTMEDLLYSLLLASANDAAVAIAIEVGGNIEAFADMMNEKALLLGLKNTHFENPHGLDSKEHYTTAHDLAIIAAKALENETFAKIVSTTKYSFDGKNGTRTVVNHNKLLRLYEDCIGVKTGFTKKSGRCLVSAAEREGLRLVAVTIGAPDDWQDHTKMLDLGFSSYKKVVFVHKNEYSVSLPITGGYDQTVLCRNNSEIYAFIPKDIDEARYKLEATLPHFLYASIDKGQRVGSLRLTLDGEPIAESDILAEYSVDKVIPKKSIFRRILEFLRII